jgi:hypothetical protein
LELLEEDDDDDEEEEEEEDVPLLPLFAVVEAGAGVV